MLWLHSCVEIILAGLKWSENASLEKFPVGIYIHVQKLTIETLEQDVKYVQS